MKKIAQQILEVSSLPINFKDRYFYYGVSNRIDASNVWNSGEIPVFSGRRGYSGRTYLSNYIKDACVYADLDLGRKYKVSDLNSKGRYAYIFVVSPAELKDIFPNESEIGRFVQEIYNYQYSEENLDQTTFRFLEWVWSILNREEQKSLMYNEGDSYSVIGKKVLDLMRNSQILWLLRTRKVRITNEGSVEFFKLYRVDRKSSSSFDPEGRDFFTKAFEVKSVEDIL